MITVENIQKSFGTVQALKSVSFGAANGKITGLLGPNGAGKTTALRILYTLLKPDSGRAQVDGYDVSEHSLEIRRCIGALPDSRGLYPRLTARENIRYYALMQGMETAKIESRIEELIVLLDMKEFADRRTQGFSTGQRLKVGIARALVHDPKNVILDEPSNGLDVMSTRALRKIIRRLSEDGRCVLFSSHIMQEISALCDHIVIIAEGKTGAEGSPDEIRRLTGEENLEDAFIRIIGTEEGVML